MICSKCIIPDSYPGAEFEDGVCVLCRKHEKSPHINKNYKSEETLRALLTSGKSRKYHCLVPLSGGKDSSYTLLHVARNMGLNPLAMHYDSGFIDEKTKTNIDKLCSSLSVDLVIAQASPYREKMLRESFAAARYSDFRGIAGIGGICINCENNIRAFAIQTARAHDIPFMVWGSTDFEDAPDSFLKEQQKSFKQGFGELTHTFGLKRMKRIYEGMVGDYRVLKYFWHLPFMSHCAKHFYYKMRDNWQMNPPGRFSRLDPFVEVTFKGTGLDVIYLFEYIQYTPFEHIAALQKEAGWEMLDGKETRQDCLLHHLANYRGFRKNGITNDGFFYSVLVRDGQLSRDEALQKEERASRDLKKNVRSVLTRIGVDPDHIRYLK